MKEKKKKESGKETTILPENNLKFKKKGWINKNCVYRGNQRYWNHLRQILQTEPPPKDLNTPTYTSIEASASVFPSKKYCDITGFVAPYTDPKTKLRYCSSEVYQFIHNSLTDSEKDQYLSLRNAQIRLK
jgi:INO80 complex subunit C